MKVGSTFRRYHRQIALIMCFPLALTVVSGAAYPIFDHWIPLRGIAGLMMKIHSGRIFGLEQIYPILNGLGLAGLLATGLSMSGVFRKRRDLANNG